MSWPATYTPRAGSIADRAIAHLRATGTQIAARPLADELDIDTATLVMCLKPAVDAGLVIKEKTDGLTRFRIGSGEPLALPEDEPEQALDTRPPAASGSVASSVFQVAPERKKKTKRPAHAVKSYDASRGLPFDPVTRTRVAAAPASSAVEKPEVAGTSPFRCGVFSDGALVLERGAQSMALDRIEFESLVQFLERTLLEKTA